MNSSSIKVLLVEDVIVAQKLAAKTLKTLNCDVDVVETGSKAIEFAKKNQYNLILMDLGLPDIDGITVAETIRKINEKYSSVPIIALTAHADESYQMDCLESGMNAYLIKPFTLEAGRHLLNKYVKVIECNPET